MTYIVPSRTTDTTNTRCKFCGAPTEDYTKQLCAMCMGDIRAFDGEVNPPAPKVPEQPELKSWTIPEPAPEPQTCQTCGGPFEPYKVGPHWVRQPIQCYACLMKKKYGPDWEPGGTKASRKLKNAIAKELALSVTKREPTSEPKEETVFDLGRINLVAVLRFNGPDEAMYKRLQEIATRERRTIEAQILYLLDGAFTG